MRKCPQCNEQTSSPRCPRCGVETRELRSGSGCAVVGVLVAGAFVLALTGAAVAFLVYVKPDVQVPVPVEPLTPSVPVPQPIVPVPPERPEPPQPVEPGPAQPPPGALEVEGLGTEDGDIDREAFRRVFRRHISQMRFCYEQELKRQPAMQGKVVVRITILASGRVSEVAIVSSTLGNSSVETCIRTRIATWIFPSFRGERIRVVYPLVFRYSD